MKKVFALVLVSTLLLIPFAAFADDAGVVGTTLTIAKTINLDLSATWPTLPITQAWIDDLFSGTLAGLIDIWDERSAPDGHGVHGPEITVEVQSLGDFEVYSSYVTTLDAQIGNNAAFIALDDTSGLGLFSSYIANLELPALSASALNSTGDHGLLYAAINGVYTYLGWGGGNNLAAGGATNTYDVQWVPTELTGDFVAGDTLDLRIYFLVVDPAL